MNPPPGYVSESALREVAGDRTVGEVITIGRQEIEAEVLTKMQALQTKYATPSSVLPRTASRCRADGGTR